MHRDEDETDLILRYTTAMIYMYCAELCRSLYKGPMPSLAKPQTDMSDRVDIEDSISDGISLGDSDRDWTN